MIPMPWIVLAVSRLRSLVVVVLVVGLLLPASGQYATASAKHRTHTAHSQGQHQPSTPGKAKKHKAKKSKASKKSTKKAKGSKQQKNKKHQQQRKQDQRKDRTQSQAQTMETGANARALDVAPAAMPETIASELIQDASSTPATEPATELASTQEPDVTAKPAQADDATEASAADAPEAAVTPEPVRDETAPRDEPRVVTPELEQTPVPTTTPDEVMTP